MIYNYAGWGLYLVLIESQVRNILADPAFKLPPPLELKKYRGAYKATFRLRHDPDSVSWFTVQWNVQRKIVDLECRVKEQFKSETPTREAGFWNAFRAATEVSKPVSVETYSPQGRAENIANWAFLNPDTLLPVKNVWLRTF